MDNDGGMLMKTWYTKQLSELVNVSVRTLHYYDKIDLLKPSIRTASNYRMYSERDLSKLQQIIALKFFGFELSQIKQLISDENNALKHFHIQVELLRKKSKRLMEASEILQRISEDCCDEQPIPWQKTTQLIEVFQMSEQLEHSWVKEIFNETEMKEYAEFEADLKANRDKQQFEAKWQALVAELNQHVDTDPRSEKGIELGEKFMTWVNDLYGKKYAHLRTRKFEKGFGEGKGLDDQGWNAKTVAWLEQAVDAYWRKRIYGLLDKVGQSNNDALITDWDQLMDEMYGNETPRKLELIAVGLTDDKVSEAAKNWLRQLRDRKS